MSTNYLFTYLKTAVATEIFINKTLDGRGNSNPSRSDFNRTIFKRYALMRTVTVTPFSVGIIIVSSNNYFHGSNKH